MLGKPRIRLNNLKTSLKFPCIGLNPIIDFISHRANETQKLRFDKNIKRNFKSGKVRNYSSADLSWP